MVDFVRRLQGWLLQTSKGPWHTFIRESCPDSSIGVVEGILLLARKHSSLFLRWELKLLVPAIKEHRLGLNFFTLAGTDLAAKQDHQHDVQ